MTDKVQKILNEIATRKLCTMDEHMAFYNDKAKEDYRFLSEIEGIIKGMQEEPVKRTPADIEAAMQEVEDKSKAFTQAHKGESADDILAQMRGEEPVSEDFEEALAAEWKGYIDRGAATVDALEENTQELAFAKGFYRGAKWKEQKDSIVSKDLEEACEQLAENARKHKAETISPFFSPTDYKQGVIDGANWKKQQMMEKAIDATLLSGNLIKQKHTTHPLHVGDKVKVIVIKKD